MAFASRELALRAAGLSDDAPLEYALENALNVLRQIDRNTTPDYSRLSTRAGVVATFLGDVLSTDSDWDVHFKSKNPRNIEGCRNRKTGDVISVHNTCANTGLVNRPDLLPQFTSKRLRPATTAQGDFSAISDDFSFSSNAETSGIPTKRHMLCIYFGETCFDGLLGEVTDFRAELVVDAVCNNAGITGYGDRLLIGTTGLKGGAKSSNSNSGPDGGAIAVEPVIRKRE